MPVWLIPVIILVILVGVAVALYFVGKRMEKKKAEQEAQMAAVAQTVNMLVIDKKKMRFSEAGFPQSVIDQTPKRYRRMKLPIVKAKVGPKIMSLICDAGIFDEIPVKKEVKATVSGLYITGVKGLRKPLEKPEKKKGFIDRLRAKANDMRSSAAPAGNEKNKKTGSGKK